MLSPKLRLFGWIWTALAGALLIAALLFFFWLAVDPDPRAGKTLEFFFIPVAFVIVVVLLPAFVGGVGLLNDRPWGRIVVMVVAALLVFAVPVGTALGGIALWLLIADEMRRNKSAAAAPATPFPAGPARPRSPAARRPATFADLPAGPAGGASDGLRRLLGVGIAMVFVACCFIVVLGLGFRLSGDRVPAPLDLGFWPAVVLLAGIVAFVAWTRPFPPSTYFAGLRQQRQSREFYESWHATEAERLARLDADPALHVYAARIRAGENWPDSRIAYDRDPGMRCTCQHLQPIEGAMRQAGIEMRPSHTLAVDADCILDWAAVRARHSPGISVHYEEPAQYDRSHEDPPGSQLACRVCNSLIYARHAFGAKPGTPRFPV